MHRTRHAGFTLLELMITVAIVGLLAAIAVFGVMTALRATRNSGARFELVSLLSTARQRAVARGTDVYVIFSNVESAAYWPPASAARVLLYEDADQALRATPDALMAGLGAGRILDELSGAGSSFAANGLAFVDGKDAVIPGSGCDGTAGAVPPYMSVKGDRLTSRACGKAWCTFCEEQAG
jgi:prepilin-type N-terminal cleavage/methylation domain-containing protein